MEVASEYSLLGGKCALLVPGSMAVPRFRGGPEREHSEKKLRP